MTVDLVPVGTLAGFAAWTLLLLVVTVGVYRWSRILTGRATIGEWHPDRIQGHARYQRAIRAHMNCVENLPVFGATVVALTATGTGGALVDALCVGYFVARIAQSLVHVALEQTERVAAIRFALFAAQVVAVSALLASVVPALR